MIPRVIHQIWVGDQNKCPNKLIESWKTKHPTWEHCLWTEENMPALVCQRQFDAMKEYPGKADILRYELLYNLGGIFIDADSLCMEALDDFFLENDSFCCWENEYARTGLMANGYLGATRNNQLMKVLIEAISRMDCNQLASLPEHSAWQTVGPVFFTQAVQHARYNRLRIYPSHYFMPNHYTGLKYEGNEKVYSEQYFISSERTAHKYEDFQ